MVVHQKPVLRPQLILMAGLAVAILALLPANGSAQWFASGSDSDGPLSGAANFAITTGTNGSIMIALVNGLSADQFRSVGQGVSDVTFTLSHNVTGTPSSTSSGTAENIHSDGTMGSPSAFDPTRWKVSGGGNSFAVTT